MAKIGIKVQNRITQGLKQFLPIVASARARDVSEADTVTLVKDMLAEIFGYDKYLEVSSEFSIRGTFCDLAIKLDGKLALLLEVKAIGIDLKEQHVKQAVDYAVNQGLDWVILTNASKWQVYKLEFSKPVSKELVLELNIENCSTRSSNDIDLLYLLCKEGWQKSALGEFNSQQQALSSYTIAALLQSDTVLKTLKRELKRLSTDVRIEEADIIRVLVSEVIKRDALEGDKAKEAKRRVNRLEKEKANKESSPKGLSGNAPLTEDQSPNENIRSAIHP